VGDFGGYVKWGTGGEHGESKKEWGGEGGEEKKEERRGGGGGGVFEQARVIERKRLC